MFLCRNGLESSYHKAHIYSAVNLEVENYLGQHLKDLQKLNQWDVGFYVDLVINIHTPRPLK